MSRQATRSLTTFCLLVLRIAHPRDAPRTRASRGCEARSEKYYAMARRKRVVAVTMIAAAMQVSVRYCGHSSATPIPLRNTPRTISRKYRIGFTTVIHWKTFGILSIGDTNPDEYLLNVVVQ